MCGSSTLPSLDCRTSAWSIRRLIKLKSKFCSFPKKRIITLFGLFENEIGPGVLQLTVQKVSTLQENKGTRSQPLKMFRFCPCCLEFLKGICLLNGGLDHSRSSLVSEIRDDFIFGMLYSVSFHNALFQRDLR